MVDRYLFSFVSSNHRAFSLSLSLSLLPSLPSSTGDDELTIDRYGGAKTAPTDILSSHSQVADKRRNIHRSLSIICWLLSLEKFLQVLERFPRILCREEYTDSFSFNPHESERPQVIGGGCTSATATTRNDKDQSFRWIPSIFSGDI